MAVKNTNESTNTQAVNAQLAAEVTKSQNKRRECAKTYQEEDKVQVQGSPFYRPYFGNNMPIQLNGVMVYVPLDGKPYTIPQSFANVFNERLSRIDNLIQKQGTMSNIIEESYAGEVDLLGEVN